MHRIIWSHDDDETHDDTLRKVLDSVEASSEAFFTNVLAIK